MKAALPLLLVVAAAPLAGCGRAHDATLNEEQAAAADQRAPDPEKVMADRWAQLFDHPAAVVAAANDFPPFKIDGYKAEKNGFAARGTATYPEKPGAVTIKASFDATGATADKVETVRYTFDVLHKGSVDRAAAEIYRYPIRLVNGFLGRFQVGPGDIINSALRRRESAKAELHGTAIVVDAQPIAGGDAKDRHITVTFTRTGASAPANQTQGK
ncbi:hypothetical protein HZY97_18360 [Sphingomonas sp. R-74633]|uniref:hypothetical protein n=1 Tax=Sphingomonas sp. R-74633 TaxID=2751188 RepID=UPI0015D2167D|nr:hypothetical protein [Sphingomonas sp. R-74633]NYT42744.1 hypothetical protein [Sphingomonas sp. R-74633]